MIFEKSEKLTIISDENLGNIVGGKDNESFTIFKKYPDKKGAKIGYITAVCALAVAVTGFGICVANKAIKLFK